MQPNAKYQTRYLPGRNEQNLETPDSIESLD
jgi:hypothetical protein